MLDAKEFYFIYFLKSKFTVFFFLAFCFLNYKRKKVENYKFKIHKFLKASIKMEEVIKLEILKSKNKNFINIKNLFQ